MSWVLNIKNELSKCTEGRPLTEQEVKIIKALLKDDTNEMKIDLMYYKY